MSVFTTTANAVAREAAWLSTAGDGLPNLLTEAGGRWDLVNPYWNRTPAQRQRIVWVNRAKINVRRYAHTRKWVSYRFTLELWWPMSTQTGSLEEEAQAFDTAINDVIMRVSGFGYNGVRNADKTHGGRFLSVGETEFDGDTIETDIVPGIESMPVGVGFKATITYPADDFEFNN